VRRADSVAVRDRRQALDVGAEQLLERARLGLAQFGEFRRHMSDRAVVLAELHTDGGTLDRRSVTVGAERLGQGLGPLGNRRAGVDVDGEQVGKTGGAVLGKGGHCVFAAAFTDVAQRRRGEVVVRVREGGATGVGERIDPGRTSPAATRCRPGRALGEQPVGDQCVEVAPDRGCRQAQAIGEGGGRLRAALEDAASNGVAGAVTPRLAHHPDFHNTSMSYFTAAVRAGAGMSGVTRPTIAPR
jgi:hypothetical protein